MVNLSDMRRAFTGHGRSLTSVLLLALLTNQPSPAGGGGTVIIDGSRPGRVFEGIGALSAGASSRLLLDYEEPYRSQVLDYLFKPHFGASLHQLKVEIGGDVNSTDGTEPSFARTRAEFLHPRPECFQRGYEWMLMEEARRRNPQIRLDCLEWGCPGWIGNGLFFSQDNADYIASFIEGARTFHGCSLDYVGIWNERPYDAAWIKLLRKTLDARGLTGVRIIAPDVFDWKIAEEMEIDTELRDAVFALGIHYNERWEKDPYTSTPAAQRLGKSLRNSEGGPWRGDWEGFEYLAKLYNRSYLLGRITNVISWSLVTSYYDNLSIPNSGLMTAKTPWCGHFEVQPAVWAAAHTTQFAQPGWIYIDGGCGAIGGGTYVTLRDPTTGDYSIVIETMDTTGAQELRFELSGDFVEQPLSVWRSTKGEAEFVRMNDIRPARGSFLITLAGKSIYSLTTTKGQQKGSHRPPPRTRFPFPYRTGFETDSVGQLPRYFSDQAGVFEVVRRTDGGKCLRQVIEQQGIEWGEGDLFVQTVIGDTLWSDYAIDVNVRIPENTGYATISGRVTEVYRGARPPEGYWFKIAASYAAGANAQTSQWALYAGEERLASGQTDFDPFRWHTLSIGFKGKKITVVVDDRQITSVENGKYSHGLAGIGSGLNLIEFDNFAVR